MTACHMLDTRFIRYYRWRDLTNYDPIMSTMLEADDTVDSYCKLLVNQTISITNNCNQ